MSEITWHVTMSVDGFIAGPDHEMDWAFAADRGGHSPLAEEVRASTGAILAGRGWYDVATARYDGVAGIYGGNWSGEVLVLTHDTDPPADPTVTFVGGSFGEAVAAAREAAGGRGVEVFGATVAGEAFDHGLVDHVVIHLAPVLLREGIRLPEVPGGRLVQLERTAVDTPGAVTSLRFRVVR